MRSNASADRSIRRWRFHHLGLDEDANIRSIAMREYGFTITEHDPERPWMVLSSEHRTIKLPDGMDFSSWARDHWPAPRWSVQVDPWELSPR